MTCRAKLHTTAGHSPSSRSTRSSQHPTRRRSGECLLVALQPLNWLLMANLQGHTPHHSRLHAQQQQHPLMAMPNETPLSKSWQKQQQHCNRWPHLDVGTPASISLHSMLGWHLRTLE